MRTIAFLLSFALALAVGACTSDSSPGGGPGGSGTTDVASLDGSALSDTPAGDSGSSLVKDNGESAADEGENPCPERPPESGSSCEGDATCKYGQDCCCGECFDALVCSCGGSKWGCYFPDACLLPPCVDAGSLDTGADADEPAIDGGSSDGGAADAGEAPDAGEEDAGEQEDGGSAALPEGKCRSDGDCDRNMESCQGPGDRASCGICRNPEQPCTEDSECQGDTVCDYAREGCPTCDGGMECIARCGGTAGCREGETCNQAGHCVDAPCSSDGDCPELFMCNSAASAPVCKRRGCQDDAGCPAGGHCVNGLCWPVFGTCQLPAA